MTETRDKPKRRNRRSKWNDQFDRPDHLKFGYAAVVEKRAIRERLLADGHPDDFSLHFKIENEYIKAHANDVPFRERQKVWLAKQAENAAKRPKSALFTVEELENLIERYAGANDPVSVAILGKILEALPDDHPTKTSKVDGT